MEDNKNWLICSKQELSHAQCIEFSLPVEKMAFGRQSTEAFVINWMGNFLAYINSCPHTGVNLNWMPNQFFDLETRFLQCGLHGALFEPKSGLCVHGPCLAQSLSTLPLLEYDDKLYLDLAKLTGKSLTNA